MKTLVLVKRSLVLGACLLALGLATSCSKAPDTELLAAQESLATAREAEAEDYAYREYSAARESLEVAQRLISEQDSKFSLTRKYDHARDLLAESCSLASAARESAGIAKERTKEEALAMIFEAEQALNASRDLLVNAPVGKGNRADIELMKADLNALAPSLEEAQAAYDDGNFMSAKSNAMVVLTKAGGISDEIRAAMAIQQTSGTKKP
ncbi:MAG: hypothetical protein KJ970_12305 [Candidatus Eisenbacteria bacterium]|uniref:DUF4398 domain-containing protein n=1 Tax=Eiseniibacteriota bacterium TaxID=2212470 RepID=A0A948RVC1_UNCEI|nr:hypothetical protein [Candidatus Eisenbacteria bacterium]MBU1949802.1 hypothetical protein [Candidatus Eisenbacteria bacterium]MBU2691700.1 hypothetical protein [Candidatus Eisenbacteria bacterium]